MRNGTAAPLRILVVHSRYLSGSASGENQVVDEEVSLLRHAGHEVETIVRAVDQRRHRLGLAADVVWSRQATHDVEAAIRRHRPHVVHYHNLFPTISPAPLRAAVHAGVPVVVTLHNFRFSCLAGTLLRRSSTCEACVGHLPWRGVLHGCYRGSRSQSAVLATSLTVHRSAHTLDGVTLFLALSAFNRDKHVEAGLPADSIRVRPNFVHPVGRRTSSGTYFLYLGRLSPEKGVEELLRAWPPGVRLVVVGDGPERGRLSARAPAGVEFLGALELADAVALLSEARALVVPSLCYEGSPRAILEAFSAGVPILASDVGGLPELVHHDVNGLLVPPGEPDAWKAAVTRLLDSAESLRLGAGAYGSWHYGHTPARGLESLLAAYDVAIQRQSPNRVRVRGGIR